MNSTLTIKWRYGWLCAALSVLGVCATIPFVEMGVNDDFSYTQIALKLAQSGQLVYNGWNTPMIGLQAYWAALFIKLFGFSFTLVRLSTLPFLAGCSLMLYYLARRSGIDSGRAMLLTCFITLSPLSMPVAASFMTDIPALFFVLLCLVAALNALSEADTPWFPFWVVTLAVAGTIGGTIRQVIWLAPLVFLPYVAIWRAPRLVGAFVAAFWGAAIGAAAFFSSWFRAQPYSVSLPLIPSQRVGVAAIASNIAGLYVEFLVLSIPILIFWLPAARRLRTAQKIALAVGSLAIAWPLVILPSFSTKLASIPFGYFAGNIVTKYGVLFPGVEVLGQKPLTLSLPIQIALVALAIALQVVCAMALVPAARRAFEATRNGIAGWRKERSPAVFLQHLCLLFAAPYLLAVLSRAVMGQGIDRYLLPLLVIGGLILLLQQSKDLSRTAWPAWTATIVFALYGLATTHDYLACSRARLAAAQTLEAAHIPRLQITAGLEFDGWTEIASRGHINDPRITNPLDAYRPPASAARAAEDPYWFWSFTPTIMPTYYVVLSEQPNLVNSGYPVTNYSTWLPPTQRQVLIQVDPRARAAAAASTLSSLSRRDCKN